VTDPTPSPTEPAGLAGVHAFVTGAGSGIGAAIARRLAAEGARVTLAGRTVSKLEAVAADCPGSFSVACDVTDPDSVDKAVADARGALGPIDILINNAGAVETAKVHKIGIERWRSMIDVNLTGVFLCLSAVLPAMLEAGRGRIVNVASTAGLKGYPYVAAYCAAKHGVIGLTRATAVELAGTGVAVNAVCPGYTDTELVRESVARVMEKTGKSEEAVIASYASSIPIGRLIDTSEVADAVLYLCRAGEAVLGQSLVVAGGEIM